MIYLIIAATILVIGTLTYFKVRYEYNEFCRKEDQKDRINVLKTKILSSKNYLREMYGQDPLTKHVPEDLIPKIEFIIGLVEKTDIEHQEEKFQHLLDLVTETLLRLKTDFYNIPVVVAPLNTFMNGLVHDQIDVLRKYADEEI